MRSPTRFCTDNSRHPDLTYGTLGVFHISRFKQINFNNEANEREENRLFFSVRKFRESDFCTLEGAPHTVNHSNVLLREILVFWVVVCMKGVVVTAVVHKLR